MNEEVRFEKITELLTQYENIWRYEILETYPNHLHHYDREWIDELSKMSDEQLYQVDIKGSSKDITNTSFKDYLSTIMDLSYVEYEEIPEEIKYPSWAFHKVKQKKVHEIQVISHLLKNIKDVSGFKKVVDIGGGVGHMSRTLAHYHGIPCVSLDINKDFQDIGKKRLQKFPLPKNANEVEFITHDFSKNLNESLTKKIFSKDSFSIGLHTCGPLANHHLDIHLKEQTSGILNFGCCYNRLNPSLDLNLSQKAKENPINFSDFSLTLSARGHDSMDIEDFKFKKRVKYYRYGLHLLLTELLKRDDIYAVGDSHKRYYEMSFPEFIHHKLSELEIEHQLNKEELQQFFNDKQVILRDMFLANIIRWQLGRILELHILLDRVLYLRENGVKATIKRYFHSHLSPRNIGILSYGRKNESK